MAFVKRRMATELGIDWQKKFKSFEKQSCSAASLGQVHKAISLDQKILRANFNIQICKVLLKQI